MRLAVAPLGSLRHRDGDPEEAAMKKLARLSLVVVLVVLGSHLFGCSEDEERVTGPETGTDSLVIKENVVAMDTTDSLWVVSMDSTGMVVGYGGVEPGLDVGDVLVGSDGGGYIRRVTAVTVEDSVVWVETEFGTLADVIERGLFRLEADVAPGEGLQGAWGQRVMEGKALPGVTLRDQEFHFDNVVLFDGEADGVSLRVKIEEGWLRFKPHVKVEAGPYPPLLADHLRVAMTGRIEGRLVVSCEMGGALVGFEKKRWLYPPTIVGGFMVGPVPVTISLGLEGGIRIGTGVEGEVTGGMDGYVEVEVGAEWRSGSGWEEIWDTDLGFASTGLAWRMDGVIEAQGFVRPVVEVMIAHSAGTYLAGRPHVDAEVEVNEPQWQWAAYAGVGADAGIKVDIFGLIGLLDFYTTFVDVRVPLASGSSDDPEDRTPPGRVGDLMVVSVGASSVRLAWTAPGDDGPLGQASVYDLRYATSPQVPWESMTRVDGEPAPGPAGAREEFVVGGLEEATTYYFRLKVGDEAGNWSPASNEAYATTSGPGPAGLTFVRVPAGTFMMGDSHNYLCEDDHEVTLTHDFWISQHEVTNQEYVEALQWAYDNGYVTATTTSVRDNLDGSTEELLDLDDVECEIQFDSQTEMFYLRESPSSHAQEAYPDGYDPAVHPVKEVTWYGAAAYCDWLSMQEGLPRAYDHSDWSCGPDPDTYDPYAAEGYRLPTEAEWEYAAQFDDERLYPWGDDDPDCTRANFYDYYRSGEFCVGWTSPVGSYPAGYSGLGLWDMAGNVWDWCNDWWTCSLGTLPATDPVGPTSGSYRVVRGGGWGYYWYGLRCAERHYGRPWVSGYGVGFRVARTVAP
jgi:formylglycine-generating enzyme required for sulfatase activity